MPNIALEFVSVFGMPPVQLVKLAADLGYQHITTVLQPMDRNVEGYATWTLRDPEHRRELVSALRDHGISISLGEGLAIVAGADVRDTCPADLDAMAELGVPRINCVSLDPDLGRCFDQLAIFAGMAAERGIATMVEFVPIFTINDLPTGIAAVTHVGRPDCQLIMDTMHLGRTHASIAEIKAVDPRLIGYIQLCDVPLVPVVSDYMEEAVMDRKVPGEGELPLFEMLAALPRDVVVGLEIPMAAEARAGVGPHARMKRCLDAARGLLARIEHQDQVGAS